MTKKEFFTKWLAAFAPEVSREKLEKYVVSTGNLLWHVFSWELLEDGTYAVGDEAKNAYDRADKQEAVCIAWFEEDAAHELTWEQYTAASLDDCTEMYVVGKNFDWTYIKTHESMCGPYFLKRR